MISNDELRSAIDTVVVVMMENRSFDHLLGFLSHEAFDGRTDVNGLHQHSSDFDCDNTDSAGNLYAPTATPDGYLPCDLPHSRDQIAAELNSGAMDGFVQSYFDSQKIDGTPVPMRFCRPQDVPISAALARGYTVCDRWHAALPSDTQPNRLMALCGSTLIDSTSSVKIPAHLLPDQPTVFDWLASKGKTFEIYVDAQQIADVGAPSNLLLMKSQWRHVIERGRPLDHLAASWQSAAPAPDVLYCEPFYNDFATAMGTHGNCNHPPLPVAYGEDFLRRVYQTLTSNRAKWARTVLVICYDEHGGFFDHVRPPAMPYAAPAGNSWVEPGKPFETLGVRVPGIVVSPLVEQGSVFSGLLDHTSILQLIVDRFGTAGDLSFFGDAQARKDKQVASLSSVLTRSTPRGDILPGLKAPPFPTAGATTPAISALGKMFRGVIADKPAKSSLLLATFVLALSAACFSSACSAGGAGRSSVALQHGGRSGVAASGVGGVSGPPSGGGVSAGGTSASLNVHDTDGGPQSGGAASDVWPSPACQGAAIVADTGEYCQGPAYDPSASSGTVSNASDCGSTLWGIVRDFVGYNQTATTPPGTAHPDFGSHYCCGTPTGTVLATLGPDDKPVYNPANVAGDYGAGVGLTGPDAFAQWYNDAPGVNLSYLVGFHLVPGTDGLSRIFASKLYFPVDNEGFGNFNDYGGDGKNHNFGFTTELHTKFKYQGGEVFSFEGDDDLWVFINKKLAIDLGGIHNSAPGSVTLDTFAAQAGLVVGSVYSLDLFNAERHPSGSNFKITTSMTFVDCGVAIVPK